MEKYFIKKPEIKPIPNIPIVPLPPEITPKPEKTIPIPSIPSIDYPCFFKLRF